ncbi:hypothetical protein LguiA_033161 [Lonicera macranthoides]
MKRHGQRGTIYTGAVESIKNSLIIFPSFYDRLLSMPAWGIVHYEQLNAVACHTGNGDGSILNHPRAAHNLLGYRPDSTSFLDRTSLGDWIGDQLEPPALYQLFTRYHILNRDVRADEERTALKAAGDTAEATSGQP